MTFENLDGFIFGASDVVGAPGGGATGSGVLDQNVRALNFLGRGGLGVGGGHGRLGRSVPLTLACEHVEVVRLIYNNRIGTGGGVKWERTTDQTIGSFVSPNPLAVASHLLTPISFSSSPPARPTFFPPSTAVIT